MESITSLLSIALGAVLINNFVLSQFLGICPFMGVSKKMDTAAGMGFAVTFVMGLASAFTWLVNQILVLWELEYMQTVAFILVIAALVQLVEMFLQKSVPALYDALGVYLPLITTNCAVLGFLLVIVLFASIRERLEFADPPECFKGFPIALITAGLMALAFMGFSGLNVPV